MPREKYVNCLRQKRDRYAADTQLTRESMRTLVRRDQHANSTVFNHMRKASKRVVRESPFSVSLDCDYELVALYYVVII